MSLSEDGLCEAFADGVVDMPEMAAWLLSKTKFLDHASACRLLSDEQASLRARRRWWRHWWCNVPELNKGSETDIFMVFETTSNKDRFALHIECKKDSYRFADGQAASYAPRARHMLGKAEYHSHSDFATILLAPQKFRDRHAEEAGIFDAFVSFEKVARFLPAFAAIDKPADVRKREAGVQRDGAPDRERSARADIVQALDILDRAGKGNPPVAGDDLD